MPDPSAGTVSITFNGTKLPIPASENREYSSFLQNWIQTSALQSTPVINYVYTFGSVLYSLLRDLADTAVDMSNWTIIAEALPAVTLIT